MTSHCVTRRARFPFTDDSSARSTTRSGKLRVAFQARTAISRKEFALTRELEKESGVLLLAKDIKIYINAECTRADG